MIVTCVHVKVKPESIEDFIIETTTNHRESVKEPGNLRFDLIHQSDDPCNFIICEGYISEQAAADHNKAPNLKILKRYLLHV